MASINYEQWALDMCSLLDAIEAALSSNDHERAKTLVRGRFSVAEKHGLEVKIIGVHPGGIQ